MRLIFGNMCKSESQKVLFLISTNSTIMQLDTYNSLAKIIKFL